MTEQSPKRMESVDHRTHFQIVAGEEAGSDEDTDVLVSRQHENPAVGTDVWLLSEDEAFQLADRLTTHLEAREDE